jgi:hypothetical protein
MDSAPLSSEPEFSAALDRVGERVPDREAELERQLAASEAARAEMVSKLNQVEQALAMTQLSLLNAERRASEAEAHVVQPREEPGRSPQPEPFYPGPTTVAEASLTVEESAKPESDPRDDDDASAAAPTPLLTRIAELRDAVEAAAEEGDVTPPHDDGIPSFRERLSRAAGARHGGAGS